MCASMRRLLSEKPWILIVALLGGFVLAWMGFLVIAHKNPPVMIEPAPPSTK